MFDFYARRPHYIDHLAPVWKALDAELRGSFFVPGDLMDYARQEDLQATGLPARAGNFMNAAPDGVNPLVIAAYGDMEKAYFLQPRRQFILMEHGVGLTFNNPAYAGGLQLRRHVHQFLNPNRHTQDRNAKVLPRALQAIIGTPKLDWFHGWPQRVARPKGSVVAISFHWDGSKIAAEAGNALQHYRAILPELAGRKDFTLIGHGHPRIIEALAPLYDELGIEIVKDFRDVMLRADLYINDCSSTLYEFCVTGKPVIILNAPWFKRNVQRGIRFWEYSDVGPQVNEPEELLPAIELALAMPEVFGPQRQKAVHDLYPYLGEASTRAVIELVEGQAPRKKFRRLLPRSVQLVERFEQIDGKTIGLLYMSFGVRAAAEIRKSILSMRRIGLDIPVAVVGTTPVKGTQFIPWRGESPFDRDERRNFQFRAGRIKPHLLDLSPFERTLYIDADTEFMADFLDGFKLLEDHDMALAEELLSIGELYNKPRAGWEINIVERDATIKELGGDRAVKFLNSGVIFFRKSKPAAAVFAEWSKQWLRWKQWDEQLALMRAMHKYTDTVKVCRLTPDWNHPHRHQAKIIFHNYGRGTARMNIA